MVRVETYIKDEDNFILVDEFDGQIKEPMYVEGAITLQVDEKFILTLDLWDDVNHLWGYITEGFEELIKKNEWMTNFPDQPIRLTLRTDKEHNRIEIEATPSKGLIKATAPFDEFLTVMSKAGEKFFLRMMQIVPEDRDLYQSLLYRLRGATLTLNQ